MNATLRPGDGPVTVIGASGRSGATLCRSLAGDGIPYVPVVRSAERWAATGLPGTPRIADLQDAAALRTALAGAGRI
ncbi:NADH-ubiquinone oxidoreductase, partial [Roseomonas sp. DSM 102946]|nr:NADH-ubiquinone oxidoreductase [Roseomonas sp. DSM 102946]